MSLFDIFSVAGSAMNAQSQRLNAVASNLANADSAVSANGEAYKAKQVVFAATPVGANGATGVNVAAVIDDPSPMKMVFDPKTPPKLGGVFESGATVGMGDGLVRFARAGISPETLANLIQINDGNLVNLDD